MKKLFLAFIVLAVIFGIAFNSYADSLFSSNDGVVDLPITSFLVDSTSTVAPVTSSTAPGYEVDNSLPDIVWADNEVTPVCITFRIPHDYAGGGEFRLLVDESNSTTPNQVDFAVYVNKAGGTWDSAATNQTPVELAGTATTPCVITLKPVTDMDTVNPGDYVTLKLWRDNTATGNGDLELYHAQMYYKRKIK